MQTSRILIVDDDDIALELLEHALTQSGFEVEPVHNGVEALDRIRSGQFRMVISDWEMPQMSGLELCRAIRERRCGAYTYVILVTSHGRPQDVVAGLDAGADDFIVKPFHPAELCVRVRAGQRILALDTRDVTILALAKLADSRDSETGAHLERMREYCRVLALHLSKQPKFRDEVDGEYVDALYRTSPLHDIGKVGIPDGVLLKPGRLTDREFEIMKTHTLIGARTLEAALQERPDARFLVMARDVALTHHEHYDGSGYPHGLAGSEIPLCGRIVALADAYDALTTRRIYKSAYTHEIARSIIVEDSGKHFDPDVVDAFLASEAMFVAIQRAFAEAESESSVLEQNGSPAIELLAEIGT
jgi:putative two-component system response regulator